MEDDCRCANGYYRNKPQLKLQTETTNQATFKSHPIPARQELPPPKVTSKRYDPEVLRTSYNSTFTKPTPLKEGYSSQVDSLSKHVHNQPKHVPFYSDTSYKQSFPKHEVKLEKQPAYEYKPKDVKFEGQSSYKSTFVGKQAPDLHSNQQLQTIKDYMGKKAKVPFEGQSSYKNTFTNPGAKLEKQPEYKYQPKNTKFQGESSYKSTFVPLPRDAYGKGPEYCPVHPEKVAIK